MTRGWGASEKQVKQWIAKFDVHARGCSYHPFFQVRDVPSKGRSAMAKGQKTERTHHFVSDLEYQYFILAEFAPSVFDILEQYPLLPREETISIAKELGIKHPCYPGSNTPIVMTTDMVLCTGCAGSEELQPLSIKYASDALLPLNRVLNLDALRTAVVAEESDWLNPQIPEFVVTFREFWSDRKRLKDIFFETAVELRITPADIAVLFGRAVWLRLLPIDLDSSVIHHEFPVALVSDLSRGAVDFLHSNRCSKELPRHERGVALRKDPRRLTTC